MARIRVLIVDDHAVFLEGLVTLLRLEDHEIEVVGTALNGQEALELDAELTPDVVLLDIQMPILDGVEVARRLRQRRPSANILMLTTFNDRSLISDALAAGANGYLLKDAHAVDVIQAIKNVHDGHILISADVARALSEGSPVRPTVQRPSIPDGVALEGLSPREIDVLQLLAEGKTNREIGESLNLSEKTVRNYVSRIYDVLNLHSRTRAALWATENLKSLRDDAESART